MATEMYAIYQRDVPSVNGSIAPEKEQRRELQGRAADMSGAGVGDGELHQQAAFVTRFRVVS